MESQLQLSFWKQLMTNKSRLVILKWKRMRQFLKKILLINHLDVGCGDGYFSNKLQIRCKKCFGVDPIFKN